MLTKTAMLRKIEGDESYAGGGECPVCRQVFIKGRSRDIHVINHHFNLTGGRIGQIPVIPEHWDDAFDKGLVTDAYGFLKKRL